MLVKSDLTSKDTSLSSSGICTVLIASMKLSLDSSLSRDSSVKGLRMRFQPLPASYKRLLNGCSI